MKIAILIPSGYALTSPGDGRKAQIQYQAAALERMGHTVVRLNPWDTSSVLPVCDALHIVEGAFGNFVNVQSRAEVPLVSLATFIDSNQSFWRYRLVTWLGTRHPYFLNNAGTFRRQMHNCDLVIVRSRHERRQVIEGIGVDPARTRVEIVLNGVNPPPHHDPELARRKFSLPEQYLLHVSSYGDIRKNVPRLIKAVAPTGLPLVIAGFESKSNNLNEVRTLAGRTKHVQLLPFLDEELLQSLYAGCRVFCLPSLHEGTGLVALEAAAHGAGVVITKNGGPPDYFGDLAYYVDPYDVNNIRQAIQAAWELPRGQQLQQHMLTNLTWDQSAQSLVRVFQQQNRQP